MTVRIRKLRQFFTQANKKLLKLIFRCHLVLFGKYARLNFWRQSKVRDWDSFSTQANKRLLPTSPFISFNFLSKTDFLNFEEKKLWKIISRWFRKGREGVLHAKSGKWVHWAPVIQNKFWLPWMGECHNKLIFFWQTNWVAKILC